MFQASQTKKNQLPQQSPVKGFGSEGVQLS